MTNLQRLEMEIEGISLTQEHLRVYLAENGLISTNEYLSTSNTNKRSIYKSALSILESIANNPMLMKNYKLDDMTVSAFAENLQSRIDQLERKIRQMQNDDGNGESSYFMLFQ
ncbi:hypothetical protein [Brevibacillus fortis]|uniref:hypothetical protein n=1 Tax=Brevibacillus fortis TaxID=2126352 RepID=UPI0038FC590E